MDIDDLPQRRPGHSVDLLAKDDLDRLSVTELEARIVTLEAELVRTRAKLDGATKFRSAADGLFRR